MEISEIKSRLPLSQVLKHYGLKPDKNLRLRCPFHDDRTPSLQVYYKTHTCYCFSTNCKTHGRAMDVIDFILHKEGCTKHEAILKAKAMVEGTAVETPQNGAGKPDREKGADRSALLEQVFTYFKNGVHNSKPAKEYLAGRCLDYTKTEVGYNSGQFHHGKRKDEGLIRACVEHGILLDLGTKSRTGNPAYKPFGKWCVAFPLRDEGYRITGLYFRSTLEKKNQRHFYLKNREGLYPHYPNKNTKKLILTESIIDAASLLEQAGDQEQVRGAGAVRYKRTYRRTPAGHQGTAQPGRNHLLPQRRRGRPLGGSEVRADVEGGVSGAEDHQRSSTGERRCKQPAAGCISAEILSPPDQDAQNV